MIVVAPRWRVTVACPGCVSPCLHNTHFILPSVSENHSSTNPVAVGKRLSRCRRRSLGPRQPPRGSACRSPIPESGGLGRDCPPDTPLSPLRERRPPLRCLSRWRAQTSAGLHGR